MLTSTAGISLAHADRRRFSAPSTTSATSDSRSGAPSRYAMMRFAIGLGRAQLVVGVERERALGAVEVALRLVDVGAGHRGPQRLQVQAVRRQRLRVGLDPDGRALAAGDAHQPDAGKLRQLLRHARVHQVVHLRQRHGLGRHRQRQHGRVGRVDLVVDRRLRQVVGQQAVGRVDRGLHFLLGHLDGLVEVEPQRDHRRATRAGGRHLVEPRHLPELAFQRRRDRAGHDLGAGARVEREDPDGRVVHLRQRRHRQQAIGEQARQHQRAHQQGGRDRPHDERARDVHGRRAPCPSAATRPPRAASRPRGPRQGAPRRRAVAQRRLQG